MKFNSDEIGEFMFLSSRFIYREFFSFQLRNAFCSKKIHLY
jgi:hypothetical protein